MKSQKGITLMSLIVYIIVVLAALTMLATITASFRSAVDNVDEDAETIADYNRFNMYILKEVKKTGNNIIECTDTNVKFSTGAIYKYEENTIYLLEDVDLENYKKIALVEDITECKFTKKDENGKVVLQVDIKIGNQDKKTIEYTLQGE